jgi:hypothetical protein
MLLLSVLLLLPKEEPATSEPRKQAMSAFREPLRTIHALHSILCISGVLKLDESEAGRLACHPYAPDLTMTVELRQIQEKVSGAQNELPASQAQFRAAASCHTSSSSSRSVVSGLNPPTYTRHPEAMAAGFAVEVYAG